MESFVNYIAISLFPLLYILYRVMCFISDKREERWSKFNSGISWKEYE